MSVAALAPLHVALEIVVLRSDELLVADMVSDCTGASWEQWDTAGRQGAYDLRFTGLDGRLSAVEVTSIAGPGEQQLIVELAREDFKWDQPGAWVWGVGIGHVRDLPRLRAAFPKLVALCEAAGITRPDADWRSWNIPDEDLQWLINESSSEIHSYPELALTDGQGKRRPVYVMPATTGGVVDEQLEGLTPALEMVLASETVQKHIAKVLRAQGVAERHLALVSSTLGLPNEQALGLLFEGEPPTDAPALPPGLDYLWLFPLFSRRFLVTDGATWTQFMRPTEAFAGGG